MEGSRRGQVAAEFLIGFCLCGIAFYGSAWMFFAIVEAYWPELVWRWPEIEGWKKVFWFSVLPTLFFAGVGVFVLKRRRFVGWGVFGFLAFEWVLFLTETSAAFFL